MTRRWTQADLDRHRAKYTTPLVHPLLVVGLDPGNTGAACLLLDNKVVELLSWHCPPGDLRTMVRAASGLRERIVSVQAALPTQGTGTHAYPAVLATETPILGGPLRARATAVCALGVCIGVFSPDYPRLGYTRFEFDCGTWRAHHGIPNKGDTKGAATTTARRLLASGELEDPNRLLTGPLKSTERHHEVECILIGLCGLVSAATQARLMTSPCTGASCRTQTQRVNQGFCATCKARSMST